MSTPPSQPTVYESSDAQYGLFYWIYIKRKGNNSIGKEEAINIAKSCSRIQETAQRVHDPTGLKVGIGFGKSFLEKIEHKFLTEVSSEELKYLKKAPTKYKEEPDEYFKERTFEWTQKKEKYRLRQQGPSKKLNYQPLNINGNNEKKDGDIFVHAKGNSVGTLYEFQLLFNNTIDENLIDTENTSLTRGFTFQHHRDVSGYKLGIANPVTSEERRIAAVIETGGSFALTQKWEHYMSVIKIESPHRDLVEHHNKWIGRRRESGEKMQMSEEEVSHVKLMETVRNKIVRQSLPYTEDENKGPTGLFFLAYANDTATFDGMLTRMTNNEYNKQDEIFKMSKIQRGTYWYFPGMMELDNLYNDEF